MSCCWLEYIGVGVMLGWVLAWLGPVSGDVSWLLPVLALIVAAIPLGRRTFSYG